MSEDLKPQAILFDLDDTIIDDSGNVEWCWKQACDSCASAFGDVAPAAVLAAIHRVRGWYWSDPERHREGRLDLDAARLRIVEQALTDCSVTEAGVGQRIASAYSQARKTHISLFPGALDTLSWCRANGYRTALLTNGRGTAQRSKIARFGLAPHFELILIEGEFGFGKPDPRIYEGALATLQLAPAETWMVGDNFEWDVAQPQRLGITGVWVNPLGSQVPDKACLEPHFVVGSIAELPGLLQRAR